MRSKYIVIEGLQGAGKTTARNVVVEKCLSNWVSATWFSLGNLGGMQLAEKLEAWCWISIGRR